MMERMKDKKGILAGLLFTLCLLFATGAWAETTHASSMRLNKTKATVFVGKTVKLKVRNAAGKIKWSSSNKKVAVVSSKGVVTGKKAGKAKIIAKVGGKNLTCKLTVKKVLSVSEKTITIYKNGMVAVTFLHSGQVKCKIANTSILDYGWGDDWYDDGNKIDLNLYGKKNGTTTVTISNTYNKETVKIRVTVAQVELGGYNAESETYMFGNMIRSNGKKNSSGEYYLEGTDGKDAMYRIVYHSNNTYSLISDLGDDMKCEVFYNPKKYREAKILIGSVGERFATATVNPTSYRVNVAKMSTNISLNFNFTRQQSGTYTNKEFQQIVNRFAEACNKAKNTLYNSQFLLTVLGCEVYVLPKDWSLRGVGWPNLYTGTRR